MGKFKPEISANVAFILATTKVLEAVALVLRERYGVAEWRKFQ